jgi:hypothetical protein
MTGYVRTAGFQIWSDANHSFQTETLPLSWIAARAFMKITRVQPAAKANAGPGQSRVDLPQGGAERVSIRCLELLSCRRSRMDARMLFWEDRRWHLLNSRPASRGVSCR